MKGCLTFLVVLGLAATAFAGPDERVAEIRKWYDTVQKSKAATERKIAFEAESEPMSGDLTVRDFDGGWQTLVVSYGGEHVGIDEQYYFKDGALFFVYVVTSYWRFHPDSTDEKPKTVDTRTEDRYYFDGKTCVRRLTRSATDDAEKVPAVVAKLEQKRIEPGKEGETHRERAGKLLGAKAAADVLAAFGVK
ncbi:hypothetical protein [Luteolibacter soli]|uniref:Lipoprotein n=1 Tax=Luteolibacter soli TaxID=3135280 RepID=A0ABU9APL3_9BACT